MFEAARQLLRESAPDAPRAAVDVLIVYLERRYGPPHKRTETPTAADAGHRFLRICCSALSVEEGDLFTTRAPAIAKTCLALLRCAVVDDWQSLHPA